LLEDFFCWWGTGELKGVLDFSLQWSISYQNVHICYAQTCGIWKSMLKQY
jgi:hypothetical protein